MVHYGAATAVCVVFLFCCCCCRLRFICLADPAAATTAATSYKENDKGFEIVIPRKVDEDGDFISHSVSYKTDDDMGRVYYAIPLEGEDHHVELFPNKVVLASGAIIEKIDKDGNKIRRFADAGCHFRGQVKGKPDYRAALSTCDGLAGYIRTNRGYHLIEPLKKAEGEQPHPHMVYKGSKRSTELPGWEKEFDDAFFSKRGYFLRKQAPNETNETTTSSSNTLESTTAASTLTSEGATTSSAETTTTNPNLTPTEATTSSSTLSTISGATDATTASSVQNTTSSESESTTATGSSQETSITNTTTELNSTSEGTTSTTASISTDVGGSTSETVSGATTASNSANTTSNETSTHSISDQSSSDLTNTTSITNSTSGSSSASEEGLTTLSTSSGAENATSPMNSTETSGEGTATTVSGGATGNVTTAGNVTIEANSTAEANATTTSGSSTTAIGGSQLTTAAASEGKNVSTSASPANATAATTPMSQMTTKKPKASLPVELSIEALVVLDHAILSYHKEIDIENFVLTVFNMAHDLFHDSSLGTNINLAIVRLIRLESEDHEMNMASIRNPERALEYFRKWQQKINPKDDSHPNHHDIAILFTRVDICVDERTCGFLGAAKLYGMCQPEYCAIICQDNGLRSGFTLAHQIGHTLGMRHDQLDVSSPTAEIEYSVMNPRVPANMTHWSECSRTVLRNFIDSGFGSCLYDPPTDHSFEMVEAEPGVMYDADYQCREIFGPNAALCMTGLECSNLICYIEDKGCVETHRPPAEGTSCGENKWCFRSECVEIGERPNVVNGEWGNWSEWTECSRSCGSGVSNQVRYCNSPAPSEGGKYCVGEHTRHRICSTEPCELGEPSFRDVQCAEFDSWVYPEDGKVHQWKNYPIHDENPCALYCVNEVGSIASLLPRVIDGTTCYRGIRDICINGICKEIPCDLDLESNAVEDRCGICKGDGTSCKIIRGEQSFTCNDVVAERQFLEIPVGAMNIKIEEEIPSESHIQIRDKDNKNTFIAGDSLGVFKVVGTKAWVGMIRTKQEAISIPGPITAVITVWVDIQQNSTVKYSYGIRSLINRKPEFSWDYLDWSRCSTECGPGTQESFPRCVEKQAGLVDESFCENVTKPRPAIRTCEVAPCTSRWFIGNWGKCMRCPFGVKTRIVKCYRPVGTGEGELDFIADTYCVGPKPKSSESCYCHGPERTNVTNCTMSLIRTVVDMMSLDEVKLTIHTELEGDKYPEGLPHPKNVNGSMYELGNKAAMKFLHEMQRDFSNNKTKI